MSDSCEEPSPRRGLLPWWRRASALRALLERRCFVAGAQKPSCSAAVLPIVDTGKCVTRRVAAVSCQRCMASRGLSFGPGADSSLLPVDFTTRDSSFPLSLAPRRGTGERGPRLGRPGVRGLARPSHTSYNPRCATRGCWKMETPHDEKNVRRGYLLDLMSLASHPFQLYIIAEVIFSLYPDGSAYR